MGRTRTSLQVVATLGAVSVLYALPWFLAAIGASQPTLQFELAEVEERFAEVVWTPDAPAEAGSTEADATEPTDEGATEGTPVASAREPSGSERAASTPAPIGVSVAGAPGERQPTAADAPQTADARRPRVRRKPRPRVVRAPRELTKKQQRRRERRERQRERLARQPQCDELIGQIVQVAEDEYLVGRDLVSCYRAHPRQFLKIGGMRWEEDEDGKHLGLRILISSRSRSDIARAVGFRRGDVLRSLNGVPLRSAAGSGFAAVQLLGNKAKVKFLRDGEEHKVVLRAVGERRLEKARAELAEAGEVAKR